MTCRPLTRGRVHGQSPDDVAWLTMSASGPDTSLADSKPTLQNLRMPEKYRRPHSHERVQAVERMRLAWESERDALATVRRFNAKLSAKGYSWFWPKITTAVTAKHPWLVIVCDACDTVIDLDLRVKPRDPEASIRIALRDIRCPRCNGHGRPRILGLVRHPSA